MTGWLRSRHLVRADDNGLVYVVDRAIDMINRGGENVYSVEVENALVGAPGVADAAVVGVPDTVIGEKVGAVLVPAPGAHLDPYAVIDYLKGRLADFEIPAVHRGARRAAAPQPRREDPQAAASRAGRLGYAATRPLSGRPQMDSDPDAAGPTGPHGLLRRPRMAPIGYPALQRILEEGAQLIEVLPVAEYGQMHLPPGRSISR